MRYTRVALHHDVDRMYVTQNNLINYLCCLCKYQQNETDDVKNMLDYDMYGIHYRIVC